MDRLYEIKGDDAAREQTPRPPSKHEISEMDELRSQMWIADQERGPTL